MEAKDDSTRQIIVEGARKVFQLYGYRRTTIDEIAAYLHMSKKTIYRHFKSKDELMIAVIDSLMDPMINGIEEVFEQKLGFVETYDSVINFLKSMSMQITPPMMADMESLPQLWQHIDQKRKRMLSRYQDAIMRGQQSGEVRQDIDARFLVAFMTTAIISFGTPQTLMEFQLSPLDLAHNISQIIMHGVLSPNPRNHQEHRP